MEKKKKNMPKGKKKKFSSKILTVLFFIPRCLIIGIEVLFSEKKQRELKMEDKIIPIIVITLALTSYLLSIFVITRWFVQTERNKRFAESLIDTTNEIAKEEEKKSPVTSKKNEKTYTDSEYYSDLEFLNINLTNYINQNSETVAWVQVNGTNISYPVVQHSDNKYYLNYNFYKRKSIAGWIFADYRDKFNPLNSNTIIYGHNMINGSMFTQLNYTQKTWWQTNKNYPYIKLKTKYQNTIWQVFSVYKTKPTTDYLQSIFNSTEIYQKFLDTIKSRSNYNFNVDVTYNDKILTLSTCDNSGKYRQVVHAKLIKSQDLS